MLCPICDSKRPLVEHHINGRDVYDWDMPWNKAWLCSNCHDDVHIGKIIIEGWVSSTSGKILAWHEDGNPNDIMEGATPPIY